MSRATGKGGNVMEEALLAVSTLVESKRNFAFFETKHKIFQLWEPISNSTCLC